MRKLFAALMAVLLLLLTAGCVPPRASTGTSSATTAAASMAVPFMGAFERMGYKLTPVTEGLQEWRFRDDQSVDAPVFQVHDGVVVSARTEAFECKFTVTGTLHPVLALNTFHQAEQSSLSAGQSDDWKMHQEDKKTSTAHCTRTRNGK